MKEFLAKIALGELKRIVVGALAGDQDCRRKLAVIIFVPLMVLFVIIISIIALFYGPILTANEYSADLKRNLPGFLESFINERGWCLEGDDSCEKEVEQQFYDKLATVNPAVDVDLITATIMYNVYIQPSLYEFDENGHNTRFIKYYCDAYAPFWAGEVACELYVANNYDEIYKNNLDKYVKIYSNYKQLSDQYCKADEKLSTILDVASFVLPNGELIDLGEKLVGESCEFLLWNKSDVVNTVLNTDKYYVTYKYGKDDIDVLASNMMNGGRLDYTKYRNYLISTYIPQNYSDAYANATNKDVAIQRIADEIMSYASKKEGTLLGYNSMFASCSHVTIRNGGSLEVHDLEEYVAGVTAAENGGAGPEALKLQAILARSFAVKYCDRVIDNSQKDQVYKTPTDVSIEAANATAGLVLTFEGDILSEISFASYPRSNYRGGFPGYEAQGYLCSAVNCSTGSDGRQWCTTTLYKQPNMESYELVMPDTTLSGGLWNGSHLSYQSGHCYGVSQVATRYYEEEKNYTYEQMVEEFLSPGVEIMSIYGGFGNYNGQIASTQGTNFLPYELDRFLSERGSSVQAFNESIKSAVIQAGPGTRAGVVAAANSLIIGLSQYGVKLPYISSTYNTSSTSVVSGTASGKYEGYGVAGEWGKNGKWRTSYSIGYYYQTGLDCSGYVSWAIHNGGYKYLGYASTSYDGVSSSYENAVGPKYSSSKFTAQAGDLLWHHGHIMFILGISDDGKYVIGEEAGGEAGLVVTTRSMNTSDKIIDMTSFYSNPANLDLSYYQGG